MILYGYHDNGPTDTSEKYSITAFPLFDQHTFIATIYLAILTHYLEAIKWSSFYFLINFYWSIVAL